MLQAHLSSSAFVRAFGVTQETIPPPGPSSRSCPLLPLVVFTAQASCWPFLCLMTFFMCRILSDSTLSGAWGKVWRPHCRVRNSWREGAPWSAKHPWRSWLEAGQKGLWERRALLGSFSTTSGAAHWSEMARGPIPTCLCRARVGPPLLVPGSQPGPLSAALSLCLWVHGLLPTMCASLPQRDPGDGLGTHWTILMTPLLTVLP